MKRTEKAPKSGLTTRGRLLKKRSRPDSDESSYPSDSEPQDSSYNLDYSHENGIQSSSMYEEPSEKSSTFKEAIIVSDNEGSSLKV